MLEWAMVGMMISMVVAVIVFEYNTYQQNKVIAAIIKEIESIKKDLDRLF